MNSNSDSPSKQIDNIIRNVSDWRGDTFAQLRLILLQTSPDIVEEVKWKKPSRPEGVAVWAFNGNICVADVLKNAVRLTFPKGARIHDDGKLFNTRLDSKTVGAVDFYEYSLIDVPALKAVVAEAMRLNTP